MKLFSRLLLTSIFGIVFLANTNIVRAEVEIPFEPPAFEPPINNWPYTPPPILCIDIWEIFDTYTECAEGCDSRWPNNEKYHDLCLISCHNKIKHCF
jgi:hypothetical protein